MTEIEQKINKIEPSIDDVIQHLSKQEGKTWKNIIIYDTPEEKQLGNIEVLKTTFLHGGKDENTKVSQTPTHLQTLILKML